MSRCASRAAISSTGSPMAWKPAGCPCSCWIRARALRGAQDIAGVVVTGSHSMVSHREPWSERAAQWLAGVVESDRVPVLGICYGHQLLAHALGGEAGDHPAAIEIGTVQVRTTEAA